MSVKVTKKPGKYMDRPKKVRFEPQQIVTLTAQQLADNGFDLTCVNEVLYMRIAENMRRHYEVSYSDTLREVAASLRLRPTNL